MKGKLREISFICLIFNDYKFKFVFLNLRYKREDFRMKKLLLLSGVLIVTAMLTSCCSFCKGEPMKLTFNDSGSTVNATVDQNIQLALDANATTGYSWKLESYDTKILKLKSSDYKVDSKLIGAGGEQLYCFTVIGKGKTELKLIYHRPWEKDVKPAKVFTVNIETE